MKIINPETQEALSTHIYAHKTTAKDTIIKLMKTSDKKKILKATSERKKGILCIQRNKDKNSVN